MTNPRVHRTATALGTAIALAICVALGAEVAPNQPLTAYLLIPRGQGPFPAVLVPFYEPQTSAGLVAKAPELNYGLALARRGFVTLSIGSPTGEAPAPAEGQPRLQPL